MIITNEAKGVETINGLASKKLLFSKESIFTIQDTIEVHSIEYSPEDIKNEDFLTLVADDWPEDYIGADSPEGYTYYLEHNEKKYIKIILKLIEKEKGLVIDSIDIAYYK